MTLMLLDSPPICPKRRSCRAIHHARSETGITVPDTVSARRTHGAGKPETVSERRDLVPAVNRILAAMAREISQSSIRL
jgi:hypothetical protein